MFKRIGVINRGEAAMRFIHAAREYGLERGAPLTTIAFFTEPDRRSLFVREADEAVFLGTAQFLDHADLDQAGRPRRKSSYLNFPLLADQLRRCRAEAVWPGWGFAAERPELAELCESLGLAFIGPGAAAMSLLGDKARAKALAQEVGVAVIPWSGRPIEGVDDALALAEGIGFPLMVKAAAGGGGRGIRVVRNPEELAQAVPSAQTEALAAFGSDALLLERLLPKARHLEVQILADQHGHVWPVGVRDCSVQRRHQKMLEEAPPAGLPLDVQAGLKDAAVRLARAAGYENAGTAEFLYVAEENQAYFLEMNTRLQVEHPVTELTTGLDMVKLQIHIAQGLPLSGDAPPERGHAIEVRLNAEDPDRHFGPAPGPIELFAPPSGPGLRVDTGVATGDIIPADFDSMVAKIVAHGSTRAEALARLSRALEDTSLIVRGGASNKAFLLGLLREPALREGQVTTNWLDSVMASRGEGVWEDHTPSAIRAVAVITAAIDAHGLDSLAENRQLLAAAARGRPLSLPAAGREVELRLGGQPIKVRVFRLEAQRYRLVVQGQEVEVELERHDRFHGRLTFNGTRYRVISAAHGLEHQVEVEGVMVRLSRDGGGAIKAPAPAVVLSLHVKAGDRVQKGDRLVVLEAMKMEMPVLAPAPGVVRQVLVSPNVQVTSGAPLVHLDPLADDIPAPQEHPPLMPDSMPPLDRHSPEALWAEMVRLMLGFDLTPAAIGHLVDNGSLPGLFASLRPDERARLEAEVLGLYVDLEALFGREPLDDQPSLAPIEHLQAYIRGAEDLPPAFMAALSRALGHYGLDPLVPSPALEDALVRLFRSHQLLEQKARLVMALISCWLRQDDPPADHAHPAFRVMLDRLEALTQDQIQGLCDAARQARYLLFDKPLLEAQRQEVYAIMDEHLEALRRHPDADDREERLERLVHCPHPLMGFLTMKFEAADPTLRQVMLEVLIRRFYRTRALRAFRVVIIEGASHALVRYTHNERGTHIIAKYAPLDRLQRALETTAPLLEELPPDADVVMDLFTCHPDPLAEAEQREMVALALASVDLPRPVNRVCVSVAGPGRTIHYFTFRPGEQGYGEDTLHRNIHPVMGERLELWRFDNFHVERLSSPEDIFLFRVVSRTNPRDERLMVIAEVRDLTAVRDDQGRLTGLPYLEHMYLEALSAIRADQAVRDPGSRLLWNRVTLHLWPTLTLTNPEVASMARKLTPAARGLGLEKVVLRAKRAINGSAETQIINISNREGMGLVLSFAEPTDRAIRSMSPYEMKVVQARKRGMVYPYEIIRMLTPAPGREDAEFPPGAFEEWDLVDGEARPVPGRPPGEGRANVIMGVIRSFTDKHPEGLERVIVLGDPSRDMGALAEPECRLIMAALDLAEARCVPLEWFPLSSGAKISMDSGTENLDWTARVLRRIIEFTEAGGEVNVVVHGVNVGAQSYWNAEATMLMHTRGVLIMTPAGSMVLTGKRALEVSGSVSAEDHQAIGGFDRVMGVNGQAQYYARSIGEACHILLRHYEHTYVAPGEAFPRGRVSGDPRDRDVTVEPYINGEGGFARIGDILDDSTNPGRKRPFDIRQLMGAVTDKDAEPLERWKAMRDAEMAVVWDIHLGGHPVCLVGIDSRPLPRLGPVPGDGPERWTGGTLFPLSSKKVARAINAASNNRPVVILANLSGFDGSPDSLRSLQLEYGAEIGRAVVRFSGPMVFCVVARYHGGAYVVFSRALNPLLEVAALEGTFASVIGGGPAAAVVFPREVKALTMADPRVVAARSALEGASPLERPLLSEGLRRLIQEVYAQRQGEVAERFDGVHTVGRALEVGSIQEILPPCRLRPYLIEAVERGMARVGERSRVAEGQVVMGL